MNPYIVLDILPTATDAEIRAAYLEGIKKNSPEAAGEKFQAISEAYLKIRDEESRIALILTNRTPPGESPLGAAVAAMTFHGHQPLSFEQLQDYLRKCTKK